MFKKKSGSKPSPQASSPSGKGETPPRSATRQAEPRRVEPRGVSATSRPSGRDRSPSREQIAIDAYHRWLARGEPIGTDWEDWFEAERELAATV
jgi:hypothetical protein